LEENVPLVVDVFKQVLPEKQVLKCKLDFQGARLIGNDKETI
jgi:hypothetical protein